MERDSRILYKEYLSGAVLSVGLVIIAREILIALLTWTGAEIESLGGALLGPFVIIHIICGFSGGYMVCRRRENDLLKVGIATALLAYVLEFIVNTIIMTAYVTGLWVGGGYLVGGGLSAVYVIYERTGKLFHPTLIRLSTLRFGSQKPGYRPEDVKARIQETEPLIASRGYEQVPVEPQEFIDYLSRPTPTGEKTTVEQILGSRYLMVHELVEMSELKRSGIPLKPEAVEEYLKIVYEAHFTAFEFELSMALEEDAGEWVADRISLVDSWIEDESMPPELIQVYLELKEKFAS
ncbi:MAG: TIGR04086 family membrane protein [Candidatus Bathyarchaeota archaeon]|nr:MAG: TIGR04086 family membrane protein [Candidatus Bathyarchaeota archaeon]